MEALFFYSGNIDEEGKIDSDRLDGNHLRPDFLVGPVFHFPDGSFLGRIQRKTSKTLPITIEEFEKGEYFTYAFREKRKVVASFNKGFTLFELKDLRFDENNHLLGLFAPMQSVR